MTPCPPRLDGRGRPKHLGSVRGAVRSWVVRAQIDTDDRERTMTEALSEMKQSKPAYLRLQERVAILKAAAALDS